LSYLAACLEGNTAAAIDLVMSEIERGLAPSAAYARVLLPAEREIGQLWHVGDVSVAEERLVSETTRELMAVIAARYAPSSSNGRTCIAAAVATNAHDIGLRAVADLFRLAGWRCMFLGANVPPAEIARAAEMFDVDLVVLNATLAVQLRPLGEAIETIRTLAPGHKVLVGGLAFDGMPDLWRQIGADGFAPTVEDAVGVGTALVERLQ
jgi:methanogenic corrinoid protein MtbC1